MFLFPIYEKNKTRKSHSDAIVVDNIHTKKTVIAVSYVTATLGVGHGRLYSLIKGRYLHARVAPLCAAYGSFYTYFIKEQKSVQKVASTGMSSSSL